MSQIFNLADIRRNYSRQELTENKVAASPLAQFQTWLEEALTAQVQEPTAMVLSTVNAQGQPSARVVLLKGLEGGQFQFFTNYQSRKGQELTTHPAAALTFFWPELERQVRIEGMVQQVAANLSEAYFQSRPRGSQIGAWVSPQSREIPNRDFLEGLTREFERKHGPEGVIPRPDHWGGYGLTPTQVEFWQGRPNRLHDRLLYTREEVNEGWRLSRLAP